LGADKGQLERAIGLAYQDLREMPSACESSEALQADVDAVVAKAKASAGSGGEPSSSISGGGGGGGGGGKKKGGGPAVNVRPPVVPPVPSAISAKLIKDIVKLQVGSVACLLAAYQTIVI
jgi:hypothetical protein